ncbi:MULTISPECIES: PEGA domain-containing protein [Sorangium]|uniref:PEGA domain-containing protein n=1 Tax=Sorangium TaxID=39643 RepID=UPI003D9C35F1
MSSRPTHRKHNRGPRCRRLLAAATLGLVLAAAPCALAAPQETPQPTGAPQPAADAPQPAEPTARDRAAEHYRRGLAFYDRREWSRALAEYLAARQLYTNWTATSAAALCLTHLGRHDEALEMFEALLRDFGDRLPAAAQAAAQHQLDGLRRMVGILEIDAAEPGASIVVDGRRRGEAPLSAPLRITSGSHWVRVFKEGFEPFEQRVEVAGDRLARVQARLRPLSRMGRLRVVEQKGRSLDVLVDGNIMAKAPWEGLLTPGEHTVALRGDGRLGTAPVRVEVEVDRTVPLTLSAEELVSALRIEPVPVNASVAIDGVLVGRGLWEGRLRAGAHQVEIAAPGFLPESRRVVLGRDQIEVARVALERDPSSPFWRRPSRPSRLVAEAVTRVVLVPGFGGGVAGTCIRSCEGSLGTGGAAVLQVGYELGMGLGFGVTAGHLAASQRLEGRATTVTPVGLEDNPGTVDDRLSLRGALLGGWIGLTLPLSDRVPLHFRLGGGALIGSLLDERTNGAFMASGDAPYELGPYVQQHPALFFYATPEVRLGWSLGRRVQVTASVALPLLVDRRQARWDAGQVVPAGTDGRGQFPAERLTGPVVLTIAPGIGARYEFY